MNIVKQGYEEINIDSPTKHIERIARVCYKSEGKISDGTDIKMITKLRENGHLAMLEHYRFIMQVNKCIYDNIMMLNVPYFKTSNDGRYLISFNVRALIEMVDNVCRQHTCALNKGIAKGIQTELMGYISKNYKNGKYLFDTSDFVLSTPIVFIDNNRENMSTLEWTRHGWMSVLFTTDRGITHELVRHRLCSFAQESTRYCNYSGEINIIEPLADFGFNKGDWIYTIENMERVYHNLVENGHSPQEARCILPQCTKSDIVVTANVEEWLHIFELRVMGMKGTPHPQMQELLRPLFRDKIHEWYIKHADDDAPLEIGGDWAYE